MLPDTMQAMVLDAPGGTLKYKTLPVPVPKNEQVLVKVLACGVCRTDLHVLDGELENIKYPIIPGHEIIGIVMQIGDNITVLKEGELVGIPWLGYTCGCCRFCIKGQENLCEHALFTGYTLDGGYAEYTLAYQQFCIPLPASFNDLSKAPLLCAGLIGFRSYTMVGKNVKKIGLYGFGAAAHILCQIAHAQGKEIYAFTRDGDTESQLFAKSLGAVWADGSSTPAPEKLDAAILFAPSGELVPQALKNVDKGGVVVCGGIHMSDIPAFPYRLLWEERVIRSVANLTRQDAHAFLDITANIPLKTEVIFFNLKQANEALQSLREGSIQGAAVLVMVS